MSGIDGNWADAEWRTDSLATDDNRSIRRRHVDPFDDFDPSDVGNYEAGR